MSQLKTVPFRDIIIDGSTNINDSHLFKQLKLDLSPMKYNHFKREPNLLELPEVYSSIMKKDKSVSSNECIEDVNDACFWENIETYDESQKDAIKKALKIELSLIQGPPGTGKSFIGSKIVDLILKNQSILNKKLETPILVICYTNTALDQFVEYMLHITDKIVRIGGRSKSSKLENHNLSNLRNYIRENQMRNQKLYEQEKEVLSKLFSTKAEVNKIHLSESIPKNLLNEYSSLISQLKKIRTNEEVSISRKCLEVAGNFDKVS